MEVGKGAIFFLVFFVLNDFRKIGFYLVGFFLYFFDVIYVKVKNMFVEVLKVLLYEQWFSLFRYLIRENCNDNVMLVIWFFFWGQDKSFEYVFSFELVYYKLRNDLGFVKLRISLFFFILLKNKGKVCKDGIYFM